jgi:predicted amidohydrolase
MHMRIALAQLDSRLGDTASNARRTVEAAEAARTAGAEFVVFPELQLSGYGNRAGADAALEAEGAAAIANGFASLVGFQELDDGRRYNSAAFVEGGTTVHVHRKLYLPDYAPFNEDARFDAGETMRAFDTSFGRMAVLICNDAWQPFLPTLAVQDGAEILLIPSASSTAVPEAETYWRELTRFYARMLECYVVFVNRVGTEGEFTFWGGSHVVDPLGDVIAEAPRMEEFLLIAELDLEQVTERRRALPLVGQLRPEFLRGELARLGAAGRR